MTGRLLLVALAACSFHPGAPPGAIHAGDAGDADPGAADADAEVIGPDAQECWAASIVGVSVCFDAPPSGTISVTDSQTVDTAVTGTGALECRALRSGSSDVCVIAGDSIAITGSGMLFGQGARPLVLLARTVTVDGVIDVASHVRGRQGPASDLSGCNNGTNASSAGGGQGGSFGGQGGNGGNANGASTSHGIAGAAPSNVTTLRGGCPGGHGGNTGFSLGHGGGAVLLVADTVSIGSTGEIDASGGSGEAGFAGPEGAGGGGSGGMIAIVAPAIMLDAAGQIFANGGHGGGGSTSSTDGNDGADTTAWNSGGGGGAGGSSAGDGAAGFPSGSRTGGSGGSSNVGGGGGGGGAGIVRITSGSAVTGKISPSPS